MIRTMDIILSLFGLLICSPLLIFIYLILLFETDSPVFCQIRVGRNLKSFTIIKFRTMRPNTASVASHFVKLSAITPLGGVLRRYKFDELPQLWNVLKGEMSLVGPRPCLFSQVELINERITQGVYTVRPGITGLAQVSNIDMSTPRLLAETEVRMLKNLTLVNYFKYIFMTFKGKGIRDAVKNV